MKRVAETYSTVGRSSVVTHSSLTICPFEQSSHEPLELMGRLDSNDRREPHLVEVLTNLLVEAAPDWVSTLTHPPQYWGTWFNFGVAQRLGSATNSDWQVRAGFWAAEGLRALN